MTAASSTTISNWLRTTQGSLEKAGVASARLDALLLLADVTGRDKSWLLAHTDKTLDTPTLRRLNHAVARRVTHEPLAYIRGTVEFYGHAFFVNEHVLVPRPESEDMLDLLGEHLAAHKLQLIADIGTGSGAIAISAKLAHPELTIYASDIDDACIRVAEQNASSLGADITLLRGDLLQPLAPILSERQAYGILCNLPYVPDTYPVNKAAEHEPRLALFGGDDGLDLYRRLFSQIDTLHRPAFILTEALESQHDSLEDIAKQHGYRRANTLGLAQLFTPED